METLDKKTILDLTSHSGGNCISIFIPTHRRGREVNEGFDHLLFKNQVQKVRLALQKTLKSHEVDELIKPFQDLLLQKEFWKDQQEGLAVFGTNDFFQYYQTPISFEETCRVSNRFHIAPLLPIIADEKNYYLLKLTKKNATLFNVTPHTISVMETAGIFPNGLEEITEPYEFESQYQGRVTERGDGNAASRGDITEFNKEKDHLLRDYFKAINDGIKTLIEPENKPLVLASVEYFQPIYRNANSYGRLHDKGLIGNFDSASLADIHTEANALMKPYFYEEKEKRVERYRNSSNTSRTSTGVREILTAAASGRIDTLFIAKNAKAWGTFDENTLETHVHDTAQANDEDLTDKLATLTLQYGGDIFVVNKVSEVTSTDTDMPFAALFRF